MKTKATRKTRVPSTFTSGGMPSRLTPKTQSGKVSGVAGVEGGDHVVVDRQGEGQQRRGQDAREDDRQGDLAEGGPPVGVEVHARLFERLVEAGQPGPHGDHHEADVEHDVRDQDRQEAASGPQRDPQGEHRGSQDHLRRRHRHEDQQVHRPTAAELVAGQGEGDHGAQDRGEDGRDDRDGEARHHRIGDVRAAPEADVVVEGEALPGDVLAAERVVEAEGDHHRDRREQEDDHQRGEPRQQEARQPAAHQEVNRSVPTARP